MLNFIATDSHLYKIFKITRVSFFFGGGGIVVVAAPSELPGELGDEGRPTFTTRIPVLLKQKWG